MIRSRISFRKHNEINISNQERDPTFASDQSKFLRSLSTPRIGIKEKFSGNTGQVMTRISSTWRAVISEFEAAV